MKTIKGLLIVTTIISLTSCQKQPSGDFNTDKSEYIAGDVVKLTNTSVDASSYKWTNEHFC
jgi:hypothetical protein